MAASVEAIIKGGLEGIPQDKTTNGNSNLNRDDTAGSLADLGAGTKSPSAAVASPRTTSSAASESLPVSPASPVSPTSPAPLVSPSSAGVRVPPAAALSDGNAAAKSTASTPGPQTKDSPAASASSPASSQPVTTRKGAKLSRGLTVSTKEPEPPVRPQPTTSASVQSSSPSLNASSIDPLSQHIFRRTNTELSRSSRLRTQPPRPDSPVPDVSSPTVDISARHTFPPADVGKEKKYDLSEFYLAGRKGFLGRLSMRGSKKKEDASDYASETGEPRMEGSNAHVFSSIVDSAGFIPHHKEPPRYIRVKAQNKKAKEFDRMFLAQELIGTRPPETGTDSKIPQVTVTTASQGRKKTTTGGAVWATEFSKDGKYLAAGGRDHVVRVWAVISTAEDRKAQEEEEVQNGGAGERLSAPVFLEKPVQEFHGHTGEILDLSWSKNSFLLSTSMDKTVRLWHVSRQECLCTFKHKELVSKVAFHPRDDRFFLAGCLDATLRLWSIPDKNVAFSAQMPDMITAVAFSPDGGVALAGLLSGFCYVLETEGLKSLTQIHVRSSRGKNAKGSKITGIVSMVPPKAKPGDAIVLITSTDSRVRIYNLRDKTLEAKFKGHEHSSSQLSASFSDDGKYVICGSEDRKAFIWSISPADSITKDKYPCEVFDAHCDMVTTAVFAPTKTRQLLGASGDPIYDLCNPPPILLMSLEESLAAASQSGMSDHTAHQDDPSHPAPPARPRPEESPAYIARSTHYDGNIIVTSDDTGIIKVFRQDCAANKRKHESWETGSSFSRKLGANTGLVGRSGSIITRTSAGSAAHSRRGSLSQTPMHNASGMSSATGTPQLGGSSDRILSWRQGIESNSRPSSLVGAGIATPTRSERSISPSKANRTPMSSKSGLASEARKQPYATATSSPLSPHFNVTHLSRAGHPMSPTTGTFAGARQSAEKQRSSTIGTPSATNAATAATPVTTGPTAASKAKTAAPNAGTTTSQSKDKAKSKVSDEKDDQHGGKEVDPPRFGLPAPSLTFKSTSSEDALRLDPAGASYSFWNLNKWKGIAGLRASLIGAQSSGFGSGTAGGHSSRSAGEPTSPTDSRASAEMDDRNEAAAREKAARRQSLGVLPKSPLSKSDTPGDGVGTSGDSESAAAAAAASERQPRRRSMGPGILSHFAPAILVSGGDRSAGSSPDRSGHGGGGLLHPHSRSHSPYARSGSIVSRLSSEMTSSEEGGSDNDEGDEMHCTKCGGREFKARRVSGVQRLQCSRCGKVMNEEAGSGKRA